MKQNKYNDKTFFEKYSQMNRSVKGLEGAGEWKTLEKMLPKFKGKRVLDLGCGFGWHCQYAIDHDASSVVGIDISDKMLTIAKEKTAKEIKYICEPVEDAKFPQNSFDIVISSLTFHYLESFEDVTKNISRWLVKGGNFVFSVEHPVFTAYGTQDWYRDVKGNILHFPVDNYFSEGKREANFLGEKVVKYHKTLTTYLNTLIQAGFEITGVVEPQPSKELLKTVKGMKDELRRPMMLIISAIKKDKHYPPALASCELIN
ncbi:MAG: class I SAM-dependent methyltransferase [Candidatus Levyibacteriota bacterium]